MLAINEKQKLQIPLIEDNLKRVNANVHNAYQSVPNNANKYPTLLAASKLQPREAIIEAYRCGQRVFGENYIQELYEKSNDPEIRSKCPEIQWHLIGHIQSNKINKLLGVANLSVIQTIDSVKLAESINGSIERNANIKGTIDVMVQINISKEESKSGLVELDEVEKLCHFIRQQCSRLRLVGLMTIGIYGFDCSTGPNPDFLKMLQVRDYICGKLNLDRSQLELSMGMSSDYEHAVTLGSTIVRVGVHIFGDRPYKINKP